MQNDQTKGAEVFRWTHDYLVKVLTTGPTRIVKNPRLIQALKALNRQDFVPIEKKDEAYLDKELEIGFGQTITRPTTTLQMIELTNLQPAARVLEIGTGSGYSAALLALTVGETGKVFSVERQQYLIDYSKQNLSKYPQIKNVELFFKDGSGGLPERAPYDAIILGVAVEKVPKEILAQLKIGGVLVAPLESYKIIKTTRKDVENYFDEFFDGFILDKLEQGIG